MPGIKNTTGKSDYTDIKNIVAIGTSTGGPRALNEVIPKIAGDIPAAFLIIQHMPPKFTKSLAERLNSVSELIVKEAEDGEIIKSGYAYIAPGGTNLLLKKYGENGLIIRLSNEAMGERHKPSVNVTLNSLAEVQVDNIVCVIMTGMGSDGSEGIINLKKKKKNGYIIAQDEKTSTVFGMPKTAAMTGMVDVVLPLNEIAGKITKLLEGNK